MHHENMAARIIKIDDTISMLMPHDPAYVQRRLVPRRTRAWKTFRGYFSAECSSADAWQIVGLLTKDVRP